MLERDIKICCDCWQVLRGCQLYLLLQTQLSLPTLYGNGGIQFGKFVHMIDKIPSPNLLNNNGWESKSAILS